MDQKKGTSLTTTLAVWRRDIRAAGESTILEHLQRLCKQTFHYLIFTKKSRKYPSNGFVNKVYNLVNFAKRGWGFAYMQTFPPLCTYNFSLPRRTPSPWPPPPRAISLRPSALPAARARPPYRAHLPSSCRARPPSFTTTHRTGGGATTETRARPRTTTYAATSGRRTRPRRGNGGGPSLRGGRRWTEPNWRERRWRRTRLGLGGDWREDLGWAATGSDLAWAATGTHDVCQNGAKEKKRTGTIGEKKFGGGVYTLGLLSLNAKSLGVGLFLDFTNEFGTLQTTPYAKLICKVPWRCSYEVWTKRCNSLTTIKLLGVWI